MPRNPHRPRLQHHIALGQRVADARRARGWSQRDLARELHLSRPAISLLETGANPPSIDRLLQIARVLEADPVALLFGAPAPPVATEA